MKKLFALLFMTVFMLSLTATANAATKKVQATVDVNLRKGPGLNYSITTSVKKGTILDYAGAAKTDSRGVNWFKVSYKNKKAWISSRYSNFVQVKQVKAKVNVNLRKGPGTQYGVKTSVSKGTLMTYLNQTKADAYGVNWHKVSYKGNVGWVSSRYSNFA